MLTKTGAFSSFSVDDLQQAKAFYGQTLGLEISETPEGLELQIAAGARVFVYPKPNHVPASFTVLNFTVKNIEQAVDELTRARVHFEQYDAGIKTDAKGIFRYSARPIAWFNDPAGNIISVVRTK